MSKQKKLVLVLIGLAVGFINGFFGGGGGLLVVPILVYVFKLENKKAHATSMLIILPLTISSSLVYIFSMEVDFLMSLYVAIGSSIFGFVGAKLLNKIPNTVTQLIFVGVLILAGVYMVI